MTRIILGYESFHSDGEVLRLTADLLRASGGAIRDLAATFSQLRETDVAALQGLKIGMLALTGPLTDADMAQLPAPEHALTLTNTRITDAGLEQLGRMRHLKRLELRGSKISDAGLVHFQAFPDLDFLVLSETAVSDAGLPQLTKLDKLRQLDLRKCQATTTAGVGLLRQALPNCKIEY